MSVTRLPTQAMKDTEALERLVDGLVQAHKSGKVRAAIVTYWEDSQPYTCQANCTLADEAYAIAMWQASLIEVINDR